MSHTFNVSISSYPDADNIYKDLIYKFCGGTLISSDFLVIISRVVYNPNRVRLIVRTRESAYGKIRDVKREFFMPDLSCDKIKLSYAYVGTLLSHVEDACVELFEQLYGA